MSSSRFPPRMGTWAQVKGMGEKQIEVDRRLLKGRMARLRREIEEASGCRGGLVGGVVGVS